MTMPRLGADQEEPVPPSASGAQICNRLAMSHGRQTFLGWQNSEKIGAVSLVEWPAPLWRKPSFRVSDTHA